MKKYLLFLSLILSLQSCAQKPSTSSNIKENTIISRFTPPKGYIRKEVDSTSFAYHLRNLPLKPYGTTVKYHNGKTKNNNNTYAAVIDLPIGKRDLHQCADAIIRLRAEYLYKQKKYDSIHFNFTNGFKADYNNWKKGKRIIVKGNTVFWKQQAKAKNDYYTFWKYLEMVFSYAGTASLEKELKPTTLANIQIGDVFIKGGFPGHAIIVVDMVFHKKTNQKLFILAQSYMPAQELQILTNPNDTSLSPWYTSDFDEILVTPEWVFKKLNLKRF